MKSEQVEEAMESVRTRNAPWEQVDRPVEYGDLLTIDVDGKVDGKSVINETGASYSPDPEIAFPVPVSPRCWRVWSKANRRSLT